MNFRQSGQNNGRRRRALIDESLASAESPGVAAEPPVAGSTAVVESDDQSPDKSYTTAVLTEGQPRTTDFVPRRYPTLILLLLSGVAVIAVLEASHARKDRWPDIVKSADSAAFDLAAPASLSVWFSSLMLALAGITAALIYKIRRHKVDDYRGRYRVWMWASISCWLASVDATAGVHHALRGGLVHLAGTPLFGDGSIWWISLYALVPGSVGARLLMDMWACRTASTALILAGGGYTLAAALALGLIRIAEDESSLMFESGLLMASHLLLLSSLVLYGRYVLLDAQGLLPTKRAEAPSAKVPAAADKRIRANKKSKVQRRTVVMQHEQSPSRDVTSARRSDLEPAVVSSDSQPRSEEGSLAGGPRNQHPKESASRFAVDREEPSELSGYRKLSNAERKRLRKQKRNADCP